MAKQNEFIRLKLYLLCVCVVCVECVLFSLFRFCHFSVMNASNLAPSKMHGLMKSILRFFSLAL